MKKQIRVKKSFYFVLIAVVVSAVFVAPFSFRHPQAVQAESIDSLRARANELQAQIDANNAEARRLAGEADSLKKTIAAYDNQLAGIEAQISLITVKIQQLDEDLRNAQAELDRQKELLKASITALYKKGGASTVELLVGSDSFSAFINDQTYLERLKTGIQDSAEKVIALKQQIQAQQVEQKDLLAQQEEAKKAAANARAERQAILDKTQGEEARYKAVAADIAKQQQALLAEIVARSRVLTNVGTGAYPWANYREGSWTHAGSCGYGDDIDNWGYCYRQCVSYVAWKLYATGRDVPSRYGNAADWMWRTPLSKRGYEPRVGAVAVWGGWEGHVAYVEEVYSNGQIRVSEYNAVPALQGRYSQRVMSSGDPDMFLYF